MTYVPPVYPTTIPTAGDLPDRVDDVDWLFAARYNELKKELRAALTELGTTPKGASADVAARLATLAPKATPVFTGQATIPTIDLTGGQIVFPSTPNPSANANTLDDYEKGTFNCVITPGTSGTIVMGSGVGAYVKVGGIVHISGYISISSVDTPIGTIKISVPFACAESIGVSERTCGSFISSGVNWVGTEQVVININGSDSYCVIRGNNAGTYVAESAALLSAGVYLYLGLTYKVT